MSSHTDKTQENSTPVANSVSEQQSRSTFTFQFVDNRPETIAQRKLQEMAKNSQQVKQLKGIQELADNNPQVKQAAQLQTMAGNYSAQQPIREKENNTGLPDSLKSGIENLSGHSMDDVKVHYNSDKPAQVQAHAYTQGNDIHVGTGQEKHLSHEAWHVAQQKQGRVKPTIQRKDGLSINDDTALEREANVMGRKAQNSSLSNQGQDRLTQKYSESSIIQRQVYTSMENMWAKVTPDQSTDDITQIVNSNSALQKAHDDVKAHLSHFNFKHKKGQQPEAAMQPNTTGGDVYNIYFGYRTEQDEGYFSDKKNFAASILHEMMHITSAFQFNTNVAAAPNEELHIANMHLPMSTGQGVTDNQISGEGGVLEQVGTMMRNWTNLMEEVNLDVASGVLSKDHVNVMEFRVGYAQGVVPMAHYDPVLLDVVYYLQGQRLEECRTCKYATRLLQEANERRNKESGTVAYIERESIPVQVVNQDDVNTNKCCYITTACMHYKGLDDDCEELTVLRQFRDNYLLQKLNGAALVELYYKYSPQIVTAIHRREDEEEILKRLYRIIRECVDAIKRGDNEFAYKTYCKMVLELKEEFIPRL